MEWKCWHLVVLGTMSTLWTSVDAWKLIPIEGRLKDVSVGPAGVWGVNNDDKIYYRNNTYESPEAIGNDWTLVSGRLKQLEVGTNIVFGVNKDDVPYCRLGISPANPLGATWKALDGRLEYISVSPYKNVWGINEHNQIYYRLGVDDVNICGYDWKMVNGSLKQLSSGFSGVWGVNRNNQVYYRFGTYGDHPALNAYWIRVYGLDLKYVSSANGYVLGIGTDNYVYRRVGMNFVFPLGTGWKRVGSDRFVQLDAYHDRMWAVDSGDKIFVKKLGLVARRLKN